MIAERGQLRNRIQTWRYYVDSTLTRWIVAGRTRSESLECAVAAPGLDQGISLKPSSRRPPRDVDHRQARIAPAAPPAYPRLSGRLPDLNLARTAWAGRAGQRRLGRLWKPGRKASGKMTRGKCHADGLGSEMPRGRARAKSESGAGKISLTGSIQRTLKNLKLKNRYFSH
jgi:hypothetical protein